MVMRFFLFLFSGAIFAYSASGQRSPVPALLRALRQASDDSTRCEQLLQLALAYQSINLDSMLYFAEELGKTAEKGQLESFKVSAFNTKGLAYKNKSDFEQAVSFYLKALEENRKLGDSQVETSTLLNLADVLRLQQQFDKSMAYHRQGLAVAQRTGDSTMMAKYFTNTGLLFDNMEQYDSAAAWYAKGIDLTRRHAEMTDVGLAIKINLTRLYSKQGKYEEMLPLSKEVLETSRATGNKDLLSLAAINIGFAYNKSGRPREAIPYLNEAISAAIALHNPQTRLTALGNLVDAYMGVEDYKTALEKTFTYIALKDSIQTSLYSKNIADLETRYQTQEKEAQLAEKTLQVERQRNRQRLLIFGSLAALIGVMGFAQYLQNKQKSKQKEAELAARIEHAEADKLREMNRVRSTFFANISHEFRTPLTLIISPLEQMINGTFKGDWQKYYRIMYRNGRRLLDLVNQLLDLSKLEAGKLELKASEGDLGRFVSAIAWSFESLAVRKQIEFRVVAPDQPALCYFDRDKVEKITVNLLSNAFKFTPDGGKIKVEIGVKPDPLNPSSDITAAVVVSDTGIGIPPEQLPHLFDRFYHTAQSEVQPGTGLGLALTKELAELHGGKVEVSSKEGEGSTFSISLAAGKAFFSPETIVPAPDSPPGYPKQVTGVAVKTEKPGVMEAFSPSEKPLVLIVEDNMEVREYIREQLAGTYKLIESENGRSGLNTALEQTPDLVITDVMMPEMDGMEFCRLMKTNDKTSHIPIVMLTARADQADKLEGLETGADDYLVKPFDTQELRVRVANLLDQRRKLQEHFSKTFVSFAPTELQAQNVDTAFLLRAREVIEANLDDENFSVVELGTQIGMSRSQLHRKINALTGFSPNEVIRNMRLERARQLLEKKAGNASEVAYMCGFSSPGYFTKCFKDYFGMLPSEM